MVMNVAEYKEFIPYCIKSPVVSQHSTKRHDYMEAELEVIFCLVTRFRCIFYMIQYLQKLCME